MSISKIAEEVLKEVKADLLLKKLAKEELNTASKLESSLGKKIVKLASLIRNRQHSGANVTVNDLYELLYK